MATYEDLVPRVAIHLSNCPERVILDSIKNIVREFCRKTKGWVHDCTAIEVDPTKNTYELIVPEGSTVIHIWGLDGRTGRYEENPEYFLNMDGKLQFNEVPRHSATITPLVSLMPKLESDDFPDYLINFFSDALVSGAVANLQMQPFRDWSEPNAVGVHHERYRMGIAEAERMRDDGLNKSKVRTRVRPQYI